jgi:hypothetical protein
MAADLENEVGYRKPPKANQFQRGRSGNPSGRPHKPPGLPELLRKIAKQKVLTNTKNGPKRMTKLEASLTQLAQNRAELCEMSFLPSSALLPASYPSFAEPDLHWLRVPPTTNVPLGHLSGRAGGF